MLIGGISIEGVTNANSSDAMCRGMSTMLTSVAILEAIETN